MGGIGLCCRRRGTFPAREKYPKARFSVGHGLSVELSLRWRRLWRMKRDGFEEVSRLAAAKRSGICCHDGARRNDPTFHAPCTEPSNMWHASQQSETCGAR